MANEYYNHGTVPATNSSGSSALIRTEFDNVTAGFGLLPTLGGNGNKVIVVNAGGTAMVASAHTMPTGSADTVVLLAATQTLTNKTLTAPIVNTAGPSGGQQHTLPAVASDTFTLNAATQTLTNKTLSGPSVTTTSDNGGLKVNLVTSAGNSGLAIGNEGGLRKIELLFAGSSSAGFYGITAGNSVLNFATGNFTMSFGDVATHFFKSNGQIGFGVSPTTAIDVSAAGAQMRLTSSTGTNNVAYRAENTGGQTYFAVEDSAGASFGATAYAGVLWTNNARPWEFFTNNVKRMSISGTTADITAQGVGITRVKGAVTSRSNTGVRTNDPDLIAALGTGTWKIECYVMLNATSSGVGGFSSQFAFSGTKTAFSAGAMAVFNAAFTSASSADATAGPMLTPSPITTSAGSFDWQLAIGYINVTVAGNLSFQWAQNSSNANACNVQPGSYLICTKVA